jgi:probable HAF family extracellular repeat protein
LVACYANNIPNPNAFDGDSSFLEKSGLITPLPGLPGATDTVAFSLNNDGQVVGRSTPSGEHNHAVLWDHGVIQQLGELPGDIRSAALKINDLGQAVGFSRKDTPTDNIRHAVFWYKGTSPIQLLARRNFDEGLGINEPGQIVGFSGPAPASEHPALWDKAQ